MTSVRLSHRDGPLPWQSMGDTHFLGAANLYGKKASVKEVSQLLGPIKQVADIGPLLRQLDGCFALLHHCHLGWVACVDPCRSIPLFYSTDTIADRLDLHLDGPLRQEARALMPRIEMAQGSDTYLQGWQQVEAGCFLLFGPNGPAQFPYQAYGITEEAMDWATGVEGFNQVIDRMLQWLGPQVEGRRVVLPLSGGYDSRFILSMLKELGHDAVVAVTYGKATGRETPMAQRVCDKLGVPWTFLPYGESLFHSAIHHGFDEYLLRASNGASVPQEQEYAAFAHMDKHGMLNGEAWVLPGYCGDVQAGGFIPDVFFEAQWYSKPVSAAQYIAQAICGLGQASLVKAPTAMAPGFHQFCAEVESWLLREREAKYVINGVRCYEHFGLGWALPLWQRDFIEFWRRVPLALRRDKALYVKVLNQRFFEPMGIAGRGPELDALFGSHSMASRLRRKVPTGIRLAIKRLIFGKNRRDVNNLHLLANMLYAQMTGQPKSPYSVNETVGRYLLHLWEHKGKRQENL